MDRALVRKSKHMSKVLRHDPASVGLTLDEAGWVEVLPFLAALEMSYDQLELIVKENDKSRFEFSGDGTKIRASQGHSVSVDLGYIPNEPPDVLYHGTSEGALPLILAAGLSKMERHHVHLSDDLRGAEIVSRRRKDPTVLEVDARGMRTAGHEFYLSTNGVWLVDKVPPEFLRRR